MAATASYNDGFTEKMPHHRKHHSNNNGSHNNNNNNFDSIQPTTCSYNNNHNNQPAATTTHAPYTRYEPDANLIAQAEQLRTQSRQLSDQSQQAYNTHDGSTAKSLSVQSKQLRSQAEQIEFRAHNVNRPMTEIDLHMLYVEEAVQEAEKRLTECAQQGIPSLCIIVGRGIHSTDHVLKLGPAVEAMLNQRGIQYVRDQPTVGCLLATVPGGGGGGQGMMNNQQYGQQQLAYGQAMPVQQYNAQSQQYGQQQQYQADRRQNQEPDPVQQCINILSKCTIM